jgi:hypothetical protein
MNESGSPAKLFIRCLFAVTLLLLVSCRPEADPAAGEATGLPDTREVSPQVEDVSPTPVELTRVTEQASPVSSVASPTAPNTPVIPPTDMPFVDPATVTASPTLGSERLPFNSPEYGIHAFLWWDMNHIKYDLRAVNEMDFGWVKQSFAWRDIEGIEKGNFDWYRPDEVVRRVKEVGLKLLVRIDRQPFWSQENDWPPLENAPPADLQDFGDFCGLLGERYKGRIDAYQIWNEPNLSREWGDQPPNPAEYAELLKICYQAIKKADPGAIVISAGLAPTGTGLPLAMPDDEFLQGMYDAGAAEYFDVLGLNAPGYKAPPEASPEEGEANPEYGGGRWFVFRHVEDMRAVMVANGDAHKQAAILELGWTTDTNNPEYAWHAVTEEQQADYLVRAYQYARENWQPWIGPIFTIYLADTQWTPEENEQWWWAINLPDGTRRPAFDALRDMEKSGGETSGSEVS